MAHDGMPVLATWHAMNEPTPTTCVVEALELERDTLLRVLRATRERHHTAEDIQRQAAGYRRKHPIRSLIYGVPAESKLADPARLVTALKSPAIAPTTRDALASIFRSRAVSDADLTLLKKITAIDELLRAIALENSSREATRVGVKVDQMHPLYPQWRDAIETASRRHERQGFLRSKHVVDTAIAGLVLSLPTYLVAVSTVGLNHPLVLAAVVTFFASALALIPFALDNDLGGRFWPERLAKRCAALAAGEELALLAKWHHEDRIRNADAAAIAKCLSIREAMGSALYAGGGEAESNHSPQAERPRSTPKRTATHYDSSDSSIYYD